MTEISNKYVEEMSIEETSMRVKQLSDGTIVHAGPWLKDKNGAPVWFDNYTECLYANINFKRIQTNKRNGLNEHGQTPDQEKAFKERQKEALKKKEKAAVAAEMVTQNK